MLFPISINLTEVLERFGQLSVPIVGSAIEQELRDQGEVVRLVIVDARGQPIMDSSQTKSKSLYNLYELFFLLLPWLNVFLLLFPKKRQPLKRDLLFAKVQDRQQSRMLLLIPDVLSNGLNFTILHGPLISHDTKNSCSRVGKVDLAV